MKYILRVFLFNIFALWFTSELLPALVIDGSWQTMVVSGAALTFIMLFIVPVLKILFIPINLITFGLMSWVVNVIVIYLLTLFVTDVTVSSWTFPGWSWAGFSIPSYDLSYTVSLVVVSLTITTIANMLHHVSED